MRVTVKKQVSRRGKAASAYNRMGGKRKTKAAQQKFKLQKAPRKTISNLSNMAECKKFTGYRMYPNKEPLGIKQFYVSNTASATFIPIHPFYYMRSRRDLDILSSVEGRDIFSKYLQTKLEIKYPITMFGPRGGTRPIEVIYGFVTPLNLAEKTVPNNDEPTEQDILDHVIDQVGDDFDSKNDTMEFKQRRKRSYNIVGRFKVRPNNKTVVPSPLRSDQAPGQVGTVLGAGDVPTLRRNVSWNMMKKVRYHRSHQGTPVDPLEPIIYPNEAYLPFLLIYNPDFANYGENTTNPDGDEEIRRISIRYHSCHWFNDF